MPCNDLISDTDIENIYKDDNLIVTNSISSDCETNDSKRSLVKIFDKDGNCMLQRDIERVYFRSKELFSKKEELGKVVKHEYFILKDEFQGNKIASAIHVKELETYHRNEFDEIQLDAAWDGLIVWKKMFFKFASTRDESLIKIAIQKYLKEIKNMSIEEIEKAIKNKPFSISPHFLKSDDNLDFKEWVYNGFGKIGLAKMYKEVA
jgi:hypothetical protein